MERHTPPGDFRRQVLVVAAPDDPQARELLRELRAIGLTAIIAETVSLASLASEMAVCVVVLHPGTWRSTPSIRTAMSANPRYLIPVLAEPMSLPTATWATEPVNLGSSIPEVAKALADQITAFLRASPSSPPTRKTLTTIGSRLKPSSRPRPRMRIPMHYILIITALLLGSGILWNYLSHPTRLSSHSISPVSASVTSNVSISRPYSVTVPGPGCDLLSGANWLVGGYYKTIVTPTAAVATVLSSSPAGTPKATVQGTPQVVMDSSTVTTCQSDGLLVKHLNHFDSFATIIFDHNDIMLPHHFSTQITGTLVSGSNLAWLELGVHRQRSSESYNYEHGYGNISLQIEVDGSWEVVRIGDATDQVEARLSRGFVQPAKTFTLAAVVDGPVMTFSINGKAVAKITDTTYPEGYGIDFGVSDPDAKSPPAALFSHFSYTPLPATSLTSNVAVATATAQAAKALQMPYAAAVPGLGCDKGAGQWKPASEENDYLTARCLSNGLALSQSATEKYIGSVEFYGINGTFPASYSVSVQIDGSGLNGGCAGIQTRHSDEGGYYAFFVCPDGFWQIQRFDGRGGNGNRLAKGYVAPRSSYNMLATSHGSIQSLMLDGFQVASVTDTTLTTTEHIDLAMFTQQGSPSTAIFSNFVFTPIP